MPLTPTSTINQNVVGNHNGYIWGKTPNASFPNKQQGSQFRGSYPGLYANAGSLYSVMGRITAYDGVNASSAIYHARIFKNTADPWIEFDGSNAPQYLNPNKLPAVPNFFIWNGGFASVQRGQTLYVFYFKNGGTPGTSFLAVKSFNMVTDKWGSEVVSSVVQDSTSVSQGNSTCTGLCAFPDPTSNKIYLVATEKTLSIPGSGTVVLRPGYAIFDSLAGAWVTSSAFVIMGNPNTVNADESSATIVCDCNGTLHAVFESENYDTNINTYFYQAINPNGSLSAVQSIGITEPGSNVSGIAGTLSRLIATPTELVMIYGTNWNGTSAFRTINAARAPLPAIAALPVWTLQVVLDLTGATGSPGFQGYQALFIPTDGLVAAYGWAWANTTQAKVSMVHWTSSWVDDFSPSAAVTLALTNSTVSSPPIEGETPNITFDYTAPVTIIDGGGNAPVGVERYSLISNTVTPCQSAALAMTCPVGGGTGTIGVFYSHAMVVTGGTPPYHNFHLIGGSFPPGLTIDADTGIISGTPTTSGTYAYTVEVTDSSSPPATAHVTCTIIIPSGPPPPPVGALPCAGVIPLPEIDIRFKLIKVMATMVPARHLPVRGSVK